MKINKSIIQVAFAAVGLISGLSVMPVHAASVSASAEFTQKPIVIDMSLSELLSGKPSETLPAVSASEDGRLSYEVLNRTIGTVMGPSGKETYYNLDMSGVVSIMRGLGNTDEYWVRQDGCRMLGKYIMVAADLDAHPRGSLVETSLGTGLVCDTGDFANVNSAQIDVATNWK